MRHPRVTAFLIALRFPDFVPSGREVLAAFPELDRATAYRYAKDYREAWQANAVADLNRIASRWAEARA